MFESGCAATYVHVKHRYRRFITALISVPDILARDTKIHVIVLVMPYP